MRRMEPDADYSCPYCQGGLESAEEAGGDPILCPHCGEWIAFETEDAEQIQRIELDSVRIKNISRSRTAAMRVRSYYLVGCTASAVTAFDLLWRAVRLIVSGETGWGLLLNLGAAVVFAGLAWRFISRANSISADLRQQSTNVSTILPDFSGLSDGSQVARNLERMQ